MSVQLSKYEMLSDVTEQVDKLLYVLFVMCGVKSADFQHLTLEKVTEYVLRMQPELYEPF